MSAIVSILIVKYININLLSGIRRFMHYIFIHLYTNPHSPPFFIIIQNLTQLKPNL